MPTNVKKQHRVIFRALQFIFLKTWHRWISGDKIHTCIGPRGKNSKTRYLSDMSPFSRCCQEKRHFERKTCYKSVAWCSGLDDQYSLHRRENRRLIHKCHCKGSGGEVGKAISFVRPPFHTTELQQRQEILYASFLDGTLAVSAEVAMALITMSSMHSFLPSHLKV